jgi:UDP-glucose 4-epimerase
MADVREPTTYLITGGAGFIGSHLADRLIADGHRVLVIDDLSTGRYENIKHLGQNPGFHFARASITDPIVLDRLTSEADIVVHLAAAVGVKLIVERPVHTIETNVMGTEAVLKAALRYRCRVILASTSEVYGKGNSLPFSEDDDVLLGPTSKSRWAYAASKMVDEFLGLAYRQQYGLEVVPVRFFNTVGPRQTGAYGMVVPTFVQQSLRGLPLTVYDDGSQTRCFCHVVDVVEAVVGLCGHPEIPAEVINIGGTEEITIRQLAERVIELTGSSSDIELIPYDQAYAPGFEDMRRRVPDIGRIKGILGWRPRKGLDDILADVIQHEKKSS